MDNKKYLLVVEDDKYDAILYKVKLQNSGFEVQVIGNGKDALENAKVRTPDLILLDLILPVKDGFEVLKGLKQDNKLKSIPVIVISNLGQAEDMDKAKQLGASDYLVKTNVSINEVVEKIRSYLK